MPKREDSSSGKKRRRSRSRSRERHKRRRSPREETKPGDEANLGAYTELDNPFNDINLGTKFKWHKKIEKEKKRGISPTTSRRLETSRRQQAKDELDLLNRRRVEREAEQVLREEAEARMSRLAESAQMEEWLSKDGEFQLEQERARAVIRLREKRAKAIDFLALNLKYVGAGDDPSWTSVDDDGLEIDLDEPYAIFENLTLIQIEELHDDIQKYLTLEKSEVNLEFWTNMMVVCADRLDRLRVAHSTGSDTLARQRDVNAAVDSEITALLSGKSLEELSLLQRQIQDKLKSDEAVDVDYWEGLLKSLLVWKAKAKLKAIHEVVVRNRLEQLRKKQRDEVLSAKKTGVGSQPVRTEADQRLTDYGEMSSATLDANKIDDKANKRRFPSKTEVASSKSANSESDSGPDLAFEALWKAETEKNLEEEEELFNVEAPITHPSTYSWEDKYRPRKPKYFNRVHTGYEWNKYNQTHYDTDNPPPKVVQGYKFNIFYPDLIDKSKAPTYKVVREAGHADTVLLHFSAGPPYEDIAFRIVDREWEYSHKRGFRSSFDRGCLSLWFNFRRSFYRK